MRLAPFIAAATVLAAAFIAPAPALADTTGTFTPGATWTDTSGNVLQTHGLGIVKNGSTWYAFGENKSGESSSNAAFQSISCYSSADLAHWTYHGAALSLQSSGDLGPNRVVERPKV